MPGRIKTAIQMLYYQSDDAAEYSACKLIPSRKTTQITTIRT